MRIALLFLALPLFAQPIDNRLTVSGDAEIKVAPDRVVISVGVETRNPPWPSQKPATTKPSPPPTSQPTSSKSTPSTRNETPTKATWSTTTESIKRSRLPSAT